MTDWNCWLDCFEDSHFMLCIGCYTSFCIMCFSVKSWHLNLDLHIVKCSLRWFEFVATAGCFVGSLNACCVHICCFLNPGGLTSDFGIVSLFTARFGSHAQQLQTAETSMCHLLVVLHLWQERRCLVRRCQSILSLRKLCHCSSLSVCLNS